MLHKEMLKILFGKRLRAEHNIADFDRMYFTKGCPEIKNKEDLLDYILNFAGYYNLRLPNDRKAPLDDIGMTKYIRKKYTEGALLSEHDLDKEYGILNACDLLAHVGRGVITCPDSSMLLQTKYKPLFYQALLRDRLNTKIYKITNVRPWKNDANIILRTANDCMRYMMDYCISNGLTVYDRQESADFIKYLEKSHGEGRLLNGADIERYIKVPGLGDGLLKQYWASGTKKSINFIRNNNVYVYLPIGNLDDFLGWVQRDNNAMLKNSVLKTFFADPTTLSPENVAVFERMCPGHRKNDITQVIDYCIDFASFYNIKLREFSGAPYSLVKIIDKKRRDSDLLNAADIEHKTGINQCVPALLRHFGKTNPCGTLQFVDNNGFSELYLRSDSLDSFVMGAKQYRFIISFMKLTDAFAKQKPSKETWDVPANQLSKQPAGGDALDKDIYSLTDQETDAMATMLAQSNYLEECNAVNAMFNYMGAHVFSKK